MDLLVYQIWCCFDNGLRIVDRIPKETEVVSTLLCCDPFMVVVMITGW